MRNKMLVASCLAAALALPVAANATIYSLGADYSNASNPNGAWSFTQGASILAHYAQPADGNAANVAAANGYYGVTPTFVRGPIIIKVTQNGSVAPGYNDGDFLTGDVIVHGTNPGDGLPVYVNWTAPTAGTIDFTSSLWYAHSPVVRSQNVTAILAGIELGTVTVFNGVNRPLANTSLFGSNLAVSAGDVLSFRFAPTAGQTAGSLTGISETIDFTAAPGGVPEPATWAMMLVGFGGLGAVLRRRRAETVLTA